MTADPVQLQAAILRTIAYFDVFEYPLRATEVWRWLYRGAEEDWTASVSEVESGLKDLVAAKRIERHQDFFGLPGRGTFVQQRTARLAGGAKKWRRAKSVAQFLELFPFVKFAGVVNTLAIDNAGPESDIDLLVITSVDRIWLSRLMVTGIVEMLGYRRHGANIANRICLSFYISERALDLRPLSLQPVDHHLAFWATQTVPLMDDNVFAKFKAANQTLTTRLPNAWTTDVPKIPAHRAWRGIKHFFEQTFTGARGVLLEGWARDYQRSRIDQNLQSKVHLGTTEVVVNEDVLKFHEDDRRERYNQAYIARCTSLGIQP